MQLCKALVEHNLFEPDELEEAEHVAHLLLEDIHVITAIHFPDIDFHDPSISTEEIAIHINAIQSQSLTPKEEALGHFMHHKLKTLSTWPKWQAGECKQLDHFHNLGMYSSPVKHPDNVIVLRLHWQYHSKGNGTRRSWNCCNGSPHSAPVLHGIASMYSSCIEQLIHHLFVALLAHLGYLIYGGMLLMLMCTPLLLRILPTSPSMMHMLNGMKNDSTKGLTSLMCSLSFMLYKDILNLADFGSNI